MTKAPERVQVTQEIIEGSTRADSSHCMIADAIKQQVPDALHVTVDLATIRYTRRGTGRRYVHLTPSVAQLAIVEYDQGRLVEPFDFRIDKPVQIVKSNAKKAKPGGRTGERVGVKSEPTHTKQVATPERGGTNSIPVVIGGHAPPVMRTAAHTRGRRRQFGLRALER